MSAHTRKWQAEHANYRKLLDLLETQTQLFANGEQPDYELMSDVIYYMTQYPDRFHHPREDVAFKVLLERDPAAQPLVDDLAGQHEAIGRTGAALHADLSAAAAGAMMPRAVVETDVHDYVTFLRRHMDQEEREIFPRLATFLTEGDWFLVASAIHLNADPLFGESVQARFRALHRHIAQQVHCTCEDPVESACCLD